MKKNKKKLLIVIILSLLLVSIVIGLIIYKKYDDNKKIELNKEKLYQDIVSHYNKYVITNKDSDIYVLSNNEYISSGLISKNQELTLEDIDLSYNDEYLKIEDFDYYIYYKDIDKIDNLSSIDNRYKNYIVFNKNIVTNENTSFYDIDNNLVYRFNKSFELPIIIKKDNIYGVEYNNRLLYVDSDDVIEVKDSNNTDKVNTTGIAVLNYHFFYDESQESERNDCNQIICMSTSNLKKHLDYIKENNIFTPTMDELEMYIDGYIQLPKSVVLTIDDGWRADIGSNIMAEYELNATVFLMTAGYDKGAYKNEYVEVHSHGHDLHNQGVCPGGQGGAIKCLEKTKLLADLKTSQEKLDGTTVFCYPFYEYNDYSIEVLKEAGYTMAFGGYGEDGYYKVKPGINKYKLPRYVIYSNTLVNNIASYIG